MITPHPILSTDGSGKYAARLRDFPSNWSIRVGPLLLQIGYAYRPSRARFDGDLDWVALRSDRDLHAQLDHLKRLQAIGAT